MPISRNIDSAVLNCSCAPGFSPAFLGQLPERAMTLRFQRPHAQFVREHQGLLIVLSSLVRIRRRAVAVNVAQQIEGASFVTPLSEFASQLQRPLPGRHRFVDPSRAAVRIG